MYHDNLSSEFWSQNIALSPEAMWEVQLWKESLRLSKSAYLEDQTQERCHSDASDSGWGGYCVNVAGSNVAGSWSEAKSRESSTWKELRGMRLVLMAIGEK